ncbi:uncharacterized protein B0P05DRAFT_541785 [Gilbertella persicaria]|uniref:uncharacterized protein n=1 Tax=Gilbertella persicaria TaxID=101096 RepID=UPI0022209FC9|nr:uncharacterized protein B0P05DRAFT_541785 [Gilbertella persicaria]KAI8078945.1 hypothetical protein B0P05DRAFT_541785 [Gilbertella persicaria]
MSFISDNPFADENSTSEQPYTVLMSSPNLERSPTTSLSCLFLLKFSKVFLSCGAPSHRLDYCVQVLVQKLDVKAQFSYFPGFLVVSFGDPERLDASVQMIKIQFSLNLNSLTQTYQLFESVICNEVSIEEAMDRLDSIVQTPSIYPTWLRLLAYATASSISMPLFFSGGPMDMAFGFVLGLIVASGSIFLSKKITRFVSIFDVLSSTVVGFIASVISAHLGSSCFYALSIGGVISLLPGYATLVSILEITAGEAASGILRLATTLVYSLMIGFGLAIGSSCHKIIFPTLVLITAQQCEDDMSSFYHILFVPLYTLASLVVLKGHPSKFPITLSLAALSHTVHYFSLVWFSAYPHVAAVLAAFSVAFVSNLYARFRPTIGFVDMIIGLFFLVPGSVGVASSLDSLTSSVHATEVSIILNAGQQGIIFATHMMIITVAISLGLVLAALVVYPIRKLVDYQRKTSRYRRRNWVGQVTF